MSSTESVTIRNWHSGDETFLADFVEKDGWDFSMYEIRVYMKIDPEFLSVAVDSGNTPIGFIGIVKTAPDLYYVSNIIVREDLRGKGIGRQLWKIGMERAGDTNVCLDGASYVVGWYMKNGFNLQTFRVGYYRITLTEEMKIINNTNLNIIPLSEDQWSSLIKYDRLVYPNFDREKILRAWFTDEAVEVHVAMVDEVVCGYGSIHKQADNVYSLRNVFADDEDVLETILRNMFKKLPTGCIIRFMLNLGKSLPQLLKSCEKSEGESLRLYTKKVIETNTEKIWLGPALIV